MRGKFCGKKQRKGKALRKLLSLMLVLILLVSSLCTTSLAADAQTTKETHSRSVAIVFDNSGSMYMYGETAWCRAIYSMEVFASMLNDGDTLAIYPMNQISIDGSFYDSQQSILTIQGGEDNPAVIRNIYTELYGNTPITTIDDAYNGLLQSSADEKWLVVLTDGGVFNQDPYTDSWTEEETTSQLTEKLTDYNNQVNVMYLGIGEAAAMPEVTGGMTHDTEKAYDSKDILADLTKMCNNIFGRNEMSVDNSGISFDVSLSKLFLFVQGDNIENVTLTNANGSPLTPSSTLTPHYGTMGNSGINDNGTDHSEDQGPMNTPDTELSGTLVEYDNLSAGQYSVSYSGDASSVSAYYEPDVSVKVTLTDSEGNEADLESGITAGSYQLNYSLIDNEGNPTTSALLGDTFYTVDYTINGETQEKTDSTAGSVPVELSTGDSLSTRIQVDYLDGYTVILDNQTLGWSNPIEVLPQSGDFAMQVSGGQDTYQLSQLADGTPFQVDFSYLGESVEPSQVSWSADVSGSDAQVLTDPTAGTISFAAGASPDTTAGDCTLNVTAEYEYADGKTITAEQSVPFTIEDDSNSLSGTLDISQKRYVIGQMEDGDPLVMDLSIGGEPLTAEQLDEAAANFRLDGFPEDSYTVEPLYEDSALQIDLKKGDSLETGSYELNASTTTTNNVGEQVSAEDSGKIRVRRLPWWVLPALLVLILIILGALFAFYMTRKILPKSITIDDDTMYFKVGAKNITGNASVTYSGRNKKTGSITVLSPQGAATGGAVSQVKLDLVAVDPRYKKKRKAAVKNGGVSVTPFIGGNLDIDGTSIRSDKTGTIDMSEFEGNAVITNISDGSGVTLQAKTAGAKSTKIYFRYDFIFK